MLAYVREFVPVARKAPLAGNTVYVDRGFLNRDMRSLDEHLHYRLVDVSSIKELVRRWFPRVYFNSPAKHGGHRALADIRESIEELQVLPAGDLRAAARAGLGRGQGAGRAVRAGAGRLTRAGRARRPCMIQPPRRRCTWWV